MESRLASFGEWAVARRLFVILSTPAAPRRGLRLAAVLLPALLLLLLVAPRPAAAAYVAPTGPTEIVSAGGDHTCALTPGGAVECWGDNGAGQAGNHAGPYSQVSAGLSHTCALTPAGAVECWGRNINGEADNHAGPYSQVSAGDLHTCALTPGGAVECRGRNDSGQAGNHAGPYSQVSAGLYHTCALTPDGAVECWGYNGSGQAGNHAGPYRQVSTGDDHTCGLTPGGAVECWGLNTSGQVGGVNGVHAGPYSQVNAGGDHTCALMPDGAVECWGSNFYGQVGGANGYHAGPYSQVSAGDWHTCALTPAGAVECWGRNDYNQAGNHAGPYGPYRPPMLPQIVSAGGRHSCALTTGGAVECWGNNDDGQVGGVHAGPYSQVSAGAFHTCALTTGGAVECWGFDDSGQAGNHAGPYGPYVPETSLTAAPDDPTNNNDPSFSFTSPDPNAAFECRLDGGAWVACTSPTSYTDLADGSHTFEVRAVSPPGNPDTTPDSHTWTIDATPPDTTILTIPPNPSNSGSAAFTFSGDDPGGSGVASYECQLDGGAWTACTSPQNYSGLSDGSHTFEVRAIDAAGNTDPTPAGYTWTVDTAAPTVTINQASGQSDPTSSSPINFTVEFSEPVIGFATGDVTLSGSAGATTAVVSGSGATYNVAVSGMTTSGTVIATIAAVAEDAAGNDNTASTSTDNTVTYNAPDTTPPTVTINQASGQADPTSTSPINFTVEFSEPVIGFATGDVTLSGSAGATTAVVSGSGATYNVAVSGMTNSGTVVATIAAAVAEDAAGNDNTASTSTDNTVTYNAPDTTAPTVTINQASGQADPTSAGPINFTVEFSEAVTGFATGDVTLSGTAGATTAVVSGSGATYNVAVSGMTTSGTVIATIAAAVAEDAAGNDNTASTSTDNTVTYNAPASVGALYVTARGGSVPGAGAYQKNDILRWDGAAWSVWFDGEAEGLPRTADIMAFDVDDDGDGSAWMAIRQAVRLPGIGKTRSTQIAYYNGTSWSLFFDGGDVGLKTTGERINGLEVLPGSVSPIGSGCQYYLLISTVAGGGVPVGSTNVNFTGEDVLGFCMTSGGANTAGTWHVVFEGEVEGLAKNNNLGLSANDDATTLYFTTKKAFTGDGGLVKPSELFSFSGGVFSGPLWKAADHGLNQVVDGIDVIGDIP